MSNLNRIIILILFVLAINPLHSQLIISEISPNAEVEALEQYGGGEWFEICNIGQNDMDISGYTVGHYEDASFGQSDFYLGANNDNCDCGGSYGVIKFIGEAGTNELVLPAMECIIISGMSVDCSDAYFCINARDLMENGANGIVAKYNSSRSDYPGTGNGNGRGALEGHFWRQKNYDCNAYFLWNANDEIIDAVNFNCLPQSGPDAAADPMSGGFHYPDGNGGYYDYPPAFPTPPANGPFPVGIEITNNQFTWVGESIEEGFTFQRCSNDPNFVFPPMRYDENGNETGNYYMPSCGEPNDDCCSSCDNNNYFQGIQLPGCTNGSGIGLVIEENESVAEQEVLSSAAPSCNNNESRLRSNYDENSISFCTVINTPAAFNRPYVGFVNSLDEILNAGDCSTFIGADLYQTENCDILGTSSIVSSKGRPVFEMETNADYTLCFNYDISDCNYKNRVYWDNPCFSPFYCQLDVVCPDIIQDTVSCEADVPLGIIDTMSFRTELGGMILSACDDVTISFEDSLGQVSGPKHQKILYREYTLTDGLDTSFCTVQYFIINYTPPTLVLEVDTIFLDADGTKVITPELVVDFSIDFCGNPVDTTIIDPDFIDGSNLGTMDISVSVIDSAGNITTLTIDIVVADNTAPMVICPNDTIINVPACICEGEYIFTDPPAVDENGGPVSITRIDTTGLTNGDLFPAGTTTIIYEAEDESGNITLCSYDVTVNSGDPGPILVRDTLNFSLSEICNGYPTAAMFILNTPPCGEDSYVVTIFDEDGNPISEDSLSYYRNIILDVEVAYACFNNSASSKILIEDKFAPQITCISDTISCAEIPMFGIPLAEDNCDPEPTIILLNETLENVSCSDPNLSRIITRTYTSIDDDGRRSDTCFQVLSIAKFDLNTVTFNGIDTLIYCGNNTILDPYGNPSPEITGSPMAGELSLWPDQNSLCGVTSTYEDIVNIGDNCGRTILREWTVFYWDCFEDGMRQFFQEINVADTVGPAFTCFDDIILETEAFGCEATLNLALPMANDLCNNGYSFNITYPDGFESNISEINRSLGLGDNVILLEAVDLCGQTTSCSFTVTVVDNDDPIAIVTNTQTINLTSDIQIITANDLDQGSFDECGDVTLTIARMEDACSLIADDFDSSINICCEDVNSTVMVQFLVTDESGNTGFAMVAFNVEDNIAPTIIETLPDITLNCDYSYVSGNTSEFGTFTAADSRDTLLQGIVGAFFSGLNQDGVVQDLCDSIMIEESITEDYNPTCGTGTVIRSFILTDESGNSTTSSQTITFIDPSPLTTNDINWPDNLTIINESCNPTDYNPADLDMQYSFPVIDMPTCSDVAFDNLDDVDFGPFAEDTLFVINRQWTGADWCQNNGGTFVTFDSTQLIVVLDTREPTIVGSCSAIIECNNSPTCEDLIIESSISGMDICTADSDLSYTYRIDFNTDGSYDITGTTNSLSIPFPIGDHIIEWTVIDAQSNTDMCFQQVSVMNCQFPTPICLQGLTFELEAIDTNSDGNDDDEQVSIKPSDIDGGSSAPCDAEFSLSFSLDVNDTLRTYNCDSIGTRLVQLYITDENNNQDFCAVSINIEDNNSDDICTPSTPTPLTINGNITSELGTSVDDVTVKLVGTEMATTTFDGHYQFPEMTADQYYTLKPEYETYPLDGISTLDIIKIRKHILGLDPLDSPYLILAADVNNSGSVNGLDIVALRKLILGKTLDFQGKDSWEFVPANTEFIDPLNPWLNIIEDVELDEMDGNQVVDYFALKTGDMNFSSSALMNQEIITRNSETFSYDVIEDGHNLVVGVKLENENDLTGFQFSLKYNKDLFSFREIAESNIKIGVSNISTQYEHLGVIDVSWDKYQVNETDNEYSFYLIFDTKRENTANFFELNTFSEGLAAQVYFRNGDLSTLNFKKVNDTDSSITLYQNEPNPWGSQTKISFYLPKDQYIELKVYDLTGKQYFTKKGVYDSGINEIILNKSTFRGAGIYYYSLHTGNNQLTKKMILID